MKKKYSRREFIGGSLGAGLVLAGASTGLTQLSCSGSAQKSSKNQYDAKRLLTSTLGKTGVVIPRIVFGMGTRFCNIPTMDEAIEVCNYALDNGLYYWDNAHIYENAKTGVISEERVGHVVKHRRKEIFLSTKVSARDPEKAKYEIEDSLKRLQTDHLDMLKIHAIVSMEEVNNICKKGNILDLVTRLKEEGITKYIGFSGHGNAEALKAMADTGRFDSMLIAMNQEGGYKHKRQELAIPAAKARGMGILLMKTVRPKETIPGIDPNLLIRYAMSVKGPDAVVIGMDSLEIVKANLDLLRNFKPLDDARMKELALQLTPFYNHQNLPWMQPGYCDGNWA